jgi:predicted flavoprotein YhiN
LRSSAAAASFGLRLRRASFSWALVVARRIVDSQAGSDGLGYDLARQFGLGVIEPRPALVPLVLGGDEAGWTELAGVAAEVVAGRWAERKRSGRRCW